MSKRWIQFGSAVIAMIMIANLQYAWTLFVAPLRSAHKDWSLAAVQWAFTLFIFLETWITPVEGWLIDRLGPRIFLTAGGLLVGIGWTGMGYADTLTQLYVLYGTAGVGAAFIYSGSIATALKWFPDKRGTVSGFITAGFGAGSAIFIPIIARVLAHANYRTAFLYSGIAQGLVIIIAAQVLHNPGPDFNISPAAKKPISPRIRRRIPSSSTADRCLRPAFLGALCRLRAYFCWRPHAHGASFSVWQEHGDSRSRNCSGTLLEPPRPMAPAESSGAGSLILSDARWPCLFLSRCRPPAWSGCSH